MKSLVKVVTVLFALAHASLAIAQAQSYPTKPIQIVVGFAAGGTNDILARIIAPQLAQILGQPVSVENRPGATGVNASTQVANATPDGHTLLLGSTGTQAIVPGLKLKMPYDPVKDLLPVSLVGVAGTVLVVNPNVPAKSVRELVALAKAKPGQLTYASSGTGSTLHLGAELFKQLANVDILHVPFQGNTLALADVVSGHVDMMLSAISPALPLVKAGKLRVLGVSTPGRIAELSEAPSIAESGVPNYEMSTWYGIFATGGTSPQIAERLAGAIKQAIAKPEVRREILAQGIEPKANTPTEFRKLVNDELAKWAKVIKASGIKPD